MGGTGSGPQRKVRRTGPAHRLYAPKDLVAGAVPYFRALAGRMTTHGLTQADVYMLGQLATALWIAGEAAQAMAEEGLLTTDKTHSSGEMRKQPAYTVWRNATDVSLRLAQQFGLTPASRARLGLEEEEEGPSLADLLDAD